MGRKFKLAHKKHSSVKKEAAHDEEIGGSVDNCTPDFDAVTFESASTQTDAVTTMDVCLQTTEDESTEHMHLLSPMLLTFTVKVKLDFYYSLAITEFDQLHRRLNRLRTINDWFLLPENFQSEKLHRNSQKSYMVIEVSKWLFNAE